MRERDEGQTRAYESVRKREGEMRECENEHRRERGRDRGRVKGRGDGVKEEGDVKEERGKLTKNKGGREG